MVIAGDFKNGVTFEMDGKVVQVIEFQHVKPGKGAAFVRTKLRDVIGGAVIEKTFNPTDKFPPAMIERKDMQYSYNDGDLYYFMDQETFDQFELSKSDLGDNAGYITPEDDVEVQITFYEGKAVGIVLPVNVVRTVTYCEPGVKGDTSGKATKPATLDTGIEVKVPLFINTDEKVVIDTRDGSFVERAK